MPMPVPSEQEEFLRTVFGQETGYLFVSTLDRSLPRDSPNGWRDRSFVYPLQISEIMGYCKASDASGLDVYVAAQLYQKPDRRLKQFVKTCPSAWSDLDTASPWGVDPEPSVVLETSPGRYHGFWRVGVSMAPIDAEDLSRRIAYAHHRAGADLGGWDLTQVLRVPGTRNKKYDELPIVKLLKCDPRPIPREAFDVLPQAPARSSTSGAAASDDSEPPVPLRGFDLEHWQKTESTDRSGWAMRMVAILKERGLSDRLVEITLANHPIYLAKAREKWGNRESLIHDDIRRCIQHWRDNPQPVLEIPKGGLSAPGIVPAVKPVTKESTAAYRLQTLAQLVSMTEEEAVQLIDGIIWGGRTTWAFSAPNVGKTLILLAMGMHIAAGRDFCGRKVKQGAVLLIEEDSPLSVLAEYVQLVADLYDFDLTKIPFWVNQEQGLRITDEDGLRRALSAVDACPEPPVLVMLDACERLVPSDKFNSKELDPLGRFNSILVARGIGVAIVDHTRRPPAGVGKNKFIEPTDASGLLELLYGARAKQAISDVMIHFGGALKIGKVRLTFCKFRGETPDPIDMAFVPDTGFEVTSRPSGSLTPTQQKVMRYINNAPASGWHDLSEILAGAAVAERSATRALAALVNRRWLVRADQADKLGASFRLNPDLPPMLK